MADFCKQCSVDLFGQDYEELKGLCKEGEMASAICEGCGFIHVNHLGECLSNCENDHNPPDQPKNEP